MPNNTAQSHDDSSAMRGKSMVEEVKKLPFAAVGAGDLVIAQVREQLRNLPTDTQRQMKNLQGRAGAWQERVGAMNADVVRSALEKGIAQARVMYQKLADRGERIFNERMPAVSSSNVSNNGTSAYAANGNNSTKTHRATDNTNSL